MSQTAYDRDPYPDVQLRQTHPKQMALPAALLGLGYAPAETARVLEIGCGVGGNIIAMAVAFPEGRYLGFDLASTAIEAGSRTIAELGLKNIELRTLDILEAGSELGQFDYIIANGVYSWVPKAVQDGVLRLTKQCLAPEGLAYVSYNALPGCNIRIMIRQMVLHHLRDVEGSQERIAAARDFLEFLIANSPDDDITSADVKAFCREMLGRPPAVLFHDELGQIYSPLYLHEFVAEARRFGLDLLGETNGPWWREEFFASPVGEAITAKVGPDVLQLHQYLDFLKIQAFHRSILMHADRAVERKPDPSRVRQLWVSAPFVCDTPDPDLQSGAGVAFRIDQTAMTIEQPSLKQAFHTLGEAAPGWVAVAALPEDPDVEVALLQLFTMGLVEFSAGQPAGVAEAGERPLASAFARLQIARGASGGCSLDHKKVLIEDEMGRAFIGLLDGTRTRADLAGELVKRGENPATVAGVVELELTRLGRLGLLVR